LEQLTGDAGFVVGVADLDPSDLSLMQRRSLVLHRVTISSHDAQSEKQRLFLALQYLTDVRFVSSGARPLTPISGAKLAPNLFGCM
jgi:hypothetical protein